MAKYNFELKKEIVNAYIKGKGGYRYLDKKYNVSKSMIEKWLAAYKKLGDKGLMRSRKNKTYTFEYKLRVVKLYLSSEVSYQELDLSEGIHNYALIAKWVNDFRVACIDALRPKKKGRKRPIVHIKAKLEKLLQIEYTVVLIQKFLIKGIMKQEM